MFTGRGSGSSRLRLDHGPDQAAWEVLATSGSTESGVPPLLLKSQHADTTLVCLGGEMGVAFLAGETGKLKRLEQRSGTVRLGPVTGLAEIDKTGGQLFADKATVAGAINLRG